jgi:hypothetical protein
MKLVSSIVSAAGLFLTIAPSVMVFLGRMDLDTAKGLMALGTIMWFAGALLRPSPKFSPSQDQS